MEIYGQLYRNAGNEEEEEPNVVNASFERDPCEHLIENTDIQQAALNNLEALAK